MKITALSKPNSSSWTGMDDAEVRLDIATIARLLATPYQYDPVRVKRNGR